MSQDNTPMLTEQEKRILKQVSRGLENKEIAQMLHVKPVTVEFHLGNVFKKLEVSNRTEAVVVAEKGGILKTYGNP